MPRGGGGLLGVPGGIISRDFLQVTISGAFTFAVGQALASNPFAPTIPCHRVIASNGALTGYSAPGGIQRKKSMLLAEGALKA